VDTSAAAVRAPSPATVPVGSEIGRLRRVLVHRPGEELTRLTPSNFAQFLYDDVPWAERAAQEHDAFVATLAAHGVHVEYLTDALAIALQDDVVRAATITAAVDASLLAGHCRELLLEHLQAVEPAALPQTLVAGVAFAELPLDSWLRSFLAGTEFALAPLPNQTFVRDPSAWVYDQLCLTEMTKPARRREAGHARLAQQVLTGSPEVFDRVFVSTRVEGGDLLVLGSGHVVIGVSERSSTAGALAAAENFMQRHPDHRVIITQLPVARWAMHLDTVLTMVDHDTFLAYPGLVQKLHGYQLSVQAGKAVCTGSGPLLDMFAEALGVPRVRLLGSSGDPFQDERDQWNDAYNVLTLEPGRVVSYERNHRTNDQLVRAGIDVVPFSGSELGRGRGGPRCMSCPLLRDATG